MLQMRLLYFEFRVLGIDIKASNMITVKDEFKLLEQDVGKKSALTESMTKFIKFDHLALFYATPSRKKSKEKRRRMLIIR
jgi:hypothetical protein